MQAGQEVVHRDQVDAFALERIQVAGQGGDQGLAFARPHLGDAAFVQHDAADHLDVEVTLAQDALGRLADHREGFVHDVVQGLALGEPLLEFIGLGAQLIVAERGHGRLQRIDLGYPAHHRLDLAVVG